MDTNKKPPENRSETDENSPVSMPQFQCLNCDGFFSPADLESQKFAYRVIFGVECPSNIELYCPICVEVLSQVMIDNSQPWEYPTDEEFEQALLSSDIQDDFYGNVLRLLYKEVGAALVSNIISENRYLYTGLIVNVYTSIMVYRYTGFIFTI